MRMRVFVVDHRRGALQPLGIRGQGSTCSRHCDHQGARSLRRTVLLTKFYESFVRNSQIPGAMSTLALRGLVYGPHSVML